MNEKEMVGIGLSEWKSCVLSDITEVFMGQSPKGESCGNFTGIPFVGFGN